MRIQLTESSISHRSCDTTQRLTTSSQLLLTTNKICFRTFCYSVIEKYLSVKLDVMVMWGYVVLLEWTHSIHSTTNHWCYVWCEFILTQSCGGISSHFPVNGPQTYFDHDLDLSGSRDVICQVTVWYAVWSVVLFCFVKTYSHSYFIWLLYVMCCIALFQHILFIMATAPQLVLFCVARGSRAKKSWRQFRTDRVWYLLIW